MTKFSLMTVKENTNATLKGFEPFKEVPLEFIADYFEGVKGVKRGGKLILDKNVTDKKASEIQDVWQFIKKGLVYTSTTDLDDFQYSSHEFGINTLTGKPIVTTKGKAFDSCHYDIHPSECNAYGSAKKAVLRMYIVFTKDGQYYGRFYIYDGYHKPTNTNHDIIDGAYINHYHSDFSNKNEPRLSALIYSHNNSLKRSQVKKMNSSCEYYGQGYANPANEYAYYINRLETETTDIIDIEYGYNLQILNDEDNIHDRNCYNCEYMVDEDEAIYVDRDEHYYCPDCVLYCEECEEYFNKDDKYYDVNGDIYCSSCMDDLQCN
ncbi:hypothetical protein H1N72_gp42 [Lactococcus phage P596]|uniref:Uncharacterized protein n=1 Tax=Lactococcus phage P596 TaxID=2656515 RepID=A0A5Q2F835_9CAUD|nr:hypothetical protein H1N72_gp42 [Lactococcus phage P596]QGF21105.1 hypothetical protein [Lactococcus phage P596]